MQSKTHYQSTVEEKLIISSLLFTYPIYAIGGLYITGAALGWIVLAITLLRFYVEGPDRCLRIPVIIWLWVIGMIVMLICLWIAHAQWSLGTNQTVKSSVGWAKGWALLAIFPLIGAVVNVKPEALIRAICVIGKHSVIFGVITIVLYIVKFPGHLFVSPLRILGGAGDSFFTVSFYGVNPETGAGRWQFFAPWAPAAGFVSCIFVLFCLQEKDKIWRTWGVLGCIMVALLCQSRAGWAVFICIIPFFLTIKRLDNPWVLLACGLLLPIILVVGEPIYEWVMDAFQQIKESRPNSTRVRSTLESLALQRWQSEAVYWGHGIVERGPKIVEGMPIGSHHTWFGLLFVKGFIGLLALAIPMLISASYFLLFIRNNTMARAAFCMLIVLICYSFFENLEILAYLYWPALLWLGMTLKNIYQRENYA
jgi:hypothetical protein